MACKGVAVLLLTVIFYLVSFPPKDVPHPNPNLEPSSAVSPEAVQRGAKEEGEVTGVTEEEKTTTHGPESETQDLVVHNGGAHTADPGGRSACEDCRNRCGGCCRNHPRAGNSLYVAVSLFIYTQAPFVLGIVLQGFSRLTKIIVDGECLTGLSKGFIEVSPLLFYKGATTLVCMAFEQIIGQAFVDPVDSMTLAYGLRFTFRIFDKLFYLDLAFVGRRPVADVLAAVQARALELHLRRQKFYQFSAQGVFG